MREKKKTNLELVSKSKTSDNKKKAAVKKESPFNIELTFSAESKQALENHPNAKFVVKKMQQLTLQFSQEIQKIGQAAGLAVQVRPIFDMRIDSRS